TLTGKPNESDQPFILELTESSTAEVNKHFQWTETVFPANTVTMNYPLVLLRAEELAAEVRTIILRIKENDHFGAGALSPVTGAGLTGFRTYPTVTVRVTDQVVKPSWWLGAEN